MYSKKRDLEIEKKSVWAKDRSVKWASMQRQQRSNCQFNCYVLTFVTLPSLTAYTNDDAANDDNHEQKSGNGCNDYYHWIRIPMLPPMILTCIFNSIR